MKKFSKKPWSGDRSGVAARKQLIQREMRFVLLRDVRRFTRQLLARLLDEGCNLHRDLARMMFYERFERRLTFGLPADSHARFCEKTMNSAADFSHPRYQAAVKHFLTHLSGTQTQITAAVLDVIEALKLEWQQIAQECLPNTDARGSNLQNLIAQISRVNPAGKLARHGLDTTRRRLKIAMVASLLRHVRAPDLLQENYGSVPQILQRLSRDPAFFAALMVFLTQQVPYARHVIARSFWRTLNSMDTEQPQPAANDNLQPAQPSTDRSAR